MNREVFVNSYKNAFGNVELPIVFWYSDEPLVVPEKKKRCYIGSLKPARDGGVASFDVDTILCPGGKVYAGFSEAPSYIPGFVSETERYKKTPEMVRSFIEHLEMPDKSGKFLNFASVNQIENFDGLEGLIFFAPPDVLSGLVSWILFDTEKPDAVSVPFGSGCSSMVAQTVVENQKKGHRTFLGLFDPSARPSVEPAILSLAIPMSRFTALYYTISACCLRGTRGWSKVKERINNVAPIKE